MVMIFFKVRLFCLNFSLSVKIEEKQHDLDMANRNIEHLKSLLEEKAADSLSEQQLKTQSLAGLFHFHLSFICLYFQDFIL